MTRLHADPVEVLRRDTRDGPEPDQFLWRGRLYLVREVLARWTESGGWWTSDAVRAVAAGEGAAPSRAAGRLETAPIPSSPKWAQRAWGEPAPDVGAALPGGAAVDDGESDWFRVEAGAGRAHAARHGTGVYDLRHALASGRWSLHRVLD